MSERLAIAAVQANPVLGAIEGNEALARERLDEARGQGCELAVFSELFLSGYPPEDLALKPAVQRDCRVAIARLAGETTRGCAAVVGFIAAGSVRPRNAAAVLADGEVKAIAYKCDLPNYGVFDEKRVFEPGPGQTLFELKGARIGLPICEDIWGPGPVGRLKAMGAELLVVPNGSPFRDTSDDERLAVARARVSESGLPMLYVNQMGGQDELVFDGSSFALQADGGFGMRLPLCQEAVARTLWSHEAGIWRCVEAPMADWPERLEAMYRVMVQGLRDYVNKSGFPGVILGMSGGIDSALTAVVAVDALGPERVRCVMLPYRYTSSDSLQDAEACARNLGAAYESISIAPAVEAFGEMLAAPFAGRAPDTTEENIQSRARAVTLMALSNKFGAMVMTTGNKSEMAVGYATLYGDMCGGYNVLKDVYKTDVFALSRWRNLNRPFGGPAAPMPERIITRPPSAELRPDQTDQDSLPAYEVLDGILHGLVEEEATLDEIVARGFEPETVLKVQRLLYGAEYKRRQAPPGVKLGPRAFGRDRRYPIVNGYRDRIML